VLRSRPKGLGHIFKFQHSLLRLVLSAASRRLLYQRYLNRLFTEFDHNMSKCWRWPPQVAVRAGHEQRCGGSNRRL